MTEKKGGKRPASLLLPGLSEWLTLLRVLPSTAAPLGVKATAKGSKRSTVDVDVMPLSEFLSAGLSAARPARQPQVSADQYSLDVSQVKETKRGRPLADSSLSSYSLRSRLILRIYFS